MGKLRHKFKLIANALMAHGSQLIALILLPLLFSCGKNNSSDENLKIFKYNESAGILTLDPIYAKDLPHIWACNQIFNGLVAFDDEMNVVPAIAKSWNISDDGMTYTFVLRDDVWFHEDECFVSKTQRHKDAKTQRDEDSATLRLCDSATRKVTAQDFVYSFNRVLDRKLNSSGSWIFANVKSQQPTANSLSSTANSQQPTALVQQPKYAFNAINDTVLEIELSQPFPAFLGILSMSYASVIPHEAVEYYGTEFGRHPVGTGPFKYQYWKEGVKLVFRKNPNYFETVKVAKTQRHKDVKIESDSATLRLYDSESLSLCDSATIRLPYYFDVIKDTKTQRRKDTKIESDSATLRLYDSESLSLCDSATIRLPYYFEVIKDTKTQRRKDAKIESDSATLRLYDSESLSLCDSATIRLPYLDAISISFIVDKQVAFMEFIKGKFHFMSGIDARYKDELLTRDGQLRDEYQDEIYLIREPYLNTEYLAFFLGEEDTLGKDRSLALRQAVSYSIDREKMLRYLRNGIGTLGNQGIIPAGLPGYEDAKTQRLKDSKMQRRKGAKTQRLKDAKIESDSTTLRLCDSESLRLYDSESLRLCDSESLRLCDSATLNIGYPYNPKKAEQLLKDNNLIGYELKLYTTQDYIDIAKFVQSALTEIGLNCRVEEMMPAALREKRANGNLPFFRSSWVADYPDAENYLSLFTTNNFTPQGPNYTHYSNDRFDELYQKSLTCNNLEERAKIYHEMDSLMMTEAPVVILFYDEVLRFVNKNVEGLGSNPTNMLNLKKVRIN